MKEVEVFTIEEENIDCDEDTETWIDDEEQAPKYDKWGRFESIPEISEVDASDLINGSTEMHYDACRLTDGEIEEKLRGCTAISPFTLDALRNLLQKYRADFYKKTGRIHQFEYEFQVQDKAPFFVKPYPIPINHRLQVRKEIQKMLDWGIIRRSNSKYISPLMTSEKKDNSDRVCIDGRELNKKLIMDHESPRNIEELLQICEKIQVMSSSDLTSSFWQIPLKEESKQYTAFMHEGKIYEFEVCPFGTKVSTAALVRGLDFVLRGLGNNIINFVDDMLCISSSEAQHLMHLEQFLCRIQEYNFTLSFKKSKFFVQEVDFLGFTLTKRGIKPQEGKIDLIKNYPVPRNIRHLKGFLGLVTFYTKFVRNFSAALLPLHRITQKNVKWEWGDTEKYAFKNVKELFEKHIVLAHPDPAKPYILRTDANNNTLGAALGQIDEEGDERLITCINSTLRPSELSYIVTEKELLAIVWSLQKLSTYLRGAKIYIITDHQALIFTKV